MSDVDKSEVVVIILFVLAAIAALYFVYTQLKMKRRNEAVLQNEPERVFQPRRLIYESDEDDNENLQV